MQNNPAFTSLIQMGISNVMAQAALRKTKSSDVSQLLDWIGQHENDQPTLAIWIKEQEEKEKQQPQKQEEGESISHLVNTELNVQVQSLGHSKNVSEKAIFLSGNKSLEAALKWIEDHKFDADFEEQLKMVGQPKSTLTEEEAKQKLKQLQIKIRQNRKKKEEEDALQREKNRMRYGKQMIEAKRMAEQMKVKKQMEIDKIEKQRDQQHKRKLLLQMKRQRCEKLGLPFDENEVLKQLGQPVKKPVVLSKSESVSVQFEQVRVGSFAYPEKAKVCFQTIILYLNNIVKNPTEPKFRRINTENKAFQTRIAQTFGGPQALESIGFEKDGTFLVLSNPDIEELKQIIKALERYVGYY